jgi:predicted DsbA family dithiol-disulfide isomerase
VARLRIDAWTDIVCPWCAIGRARLGRALAEAGVEADIIHRAFELDPQRAGTTRAIDVLADRYGSREDALEMMGRVRELAAEEGITLRTEDAIMANTFDAHRLVLWAQEHGQGPALLDRLVGAHFRDLEDVSDHDALLEAAKAEGLDAQKAAEVLASGAYGVQARADEEEAKLLGIHGVPFFLLEGRFGISGAQPPALFAKAIQMALAERR